MRGWCEVVVAGELECAKEGIVGARDCCGVREREMEVGDGECGSYSMLLKAVQGFGTLLLAPPARPGWMNTCTRWSHPSFLIDTTSGTFTLPESIVGFDEGCMVFFQQ